jgi:hypothetical protein
MTEQPLLVPKLPTLTLWDHEREARYRVKVVDTLTDLSAAVKRRPLHAAHGAAISRARNVLNQLYVGTFTEDGERLLECAERAIHAVRKNDLAAVEHFTKMNASLQRLRLNVLADRRR